MKRLINLILIIGITASCADIAVCSGQVDPYGFFHGIWHGWIAVFALIAGIFTDDIAMYAVNNTGGWYDLGFLIGVGALAGAGAKAT